MGTSITWDVGIGFLGVLVQRGAEADALASGTGADVLFQSGEGAGQDEEHVGGIDLDEFLVRVLGETRTLAVSQMNRSWG